MKMTSRERLIAASRQQTVDMIPLSPRLGYAVMYHCGISVPQNYLRLKDVYDFDPALNVLGHDLPFNDPYQTFKYAPGVNVDMNIVDEGRVRRIEKKIHTPDGDMHEVQKMPNPGCLEYGLNPNQACVEHMVKSREDIPKVRHLLPPVNPTLADIYHGWEYVAGDEAITRAIIYGPIDNQAGYVMAVEDLMVNYMVDRDFAVELVDMFFQRILEQTKTLLEKGVRYFFTPWYWHSLSVGWSPEIFREWFLPMIKQHVELIHSYDGIVNYYDDGDTMKIIPMMIEAGVDVFETCTPPPMCDFDIYKAKEMCDGKMTLKGYVDLLHVIKDGTIEDIRNNIEEACHVLGKDGGFILGTTDSIREDTPIKNIDAYFKYGREYGKRK